MSSHREAPEISKDPVADNTDVYAFVSPDDPSKVTLIANFIPFQSPQGGPNFYEFGDDVLYEIHVSNAGDARSDIVYQFRFTTTIRNPDTFLYNTGPITAIDAASWNRPQTYSVTKEVRGKGSEILGRNLPCPPVNVGPRSTPNYAATFEAAAVQSLGKGRKVFAGQRAEAFFVDLGAVFDLATLRPFQNLHAIKSLVPSAAAAMPGVNGLQGLNVHSIALQVPIAELTCGNYAPTKVDDPNATIGVWATASRKRARVFNAAKGKTEGVGRFVQVSRLGNPLFNEVLTPMSRKDKWNASAPSQDSDYARYVTDPEVARLLPGLYPGVFPNLAAYKKPRADLAAILLTGIPTGVVPGFQNFTGPTQADMLRLNVAIKPSATPSEFGVVGGDLAGFPNGRRVADNVVAIELRAIAGATIPLVDPTYTPDAAAGILTDGTTNTNPPPSNKFPYLGTPGGGFQSTPGTAVV